MLLYCHHCLYADSVWYTNLVFVHISHSINSPKTLVLLQLQSWLFFTWSCILGNLELTPSKITINKLFKCLSTIRKEVCCTLITLLSVFLGPFTTMELCYSVQPQKLSSMEEGGKYLLWKSCYPSCCHLCYPSCYHNLLCPSP